MICECPKKMINAKKNIFTYKEIKLLRLLPILFTLFTPEILESFQFILLAGTGVSSNIILLNSEDSLEIMGEILIHRMPWALAGGKGLFFRLNQRLQVINLRQ